MDYLDMLCESVDRAYDRFERLFEGVSIGGQSFSSGR